MTTTPLNSPLASLRDSLDGSLALPDDEGWDAARRPWHPGIDQRPAAVVNAASVADVQATVRFAAEHGLAVTAQAKGHGATDALAGAVLLRTGALDLLEVDAVSGSARVGAGVPWGRVLPTLDGTGLTALAGSHPGVTTVPYTLGGGLSWFSRAYGTSAGSLISAEVVDAHGEHRRVDETTDPELLWALRGGGGDFAVVTAAEIALHAAPELYGGRLVLPGTAAPAVLRAFAEVTGSAPDRLSVWVSRMHFPAAPVLPPELRGQSFTFVDAVHLGSPEEAEALLRPLRSAGPVLRETMRPLRPSELGSVAEEPEEAGPSLAVSQPLTAFEPETAAQLLTHGAPESGLNLIAVRHLGGALAAPADRPGAGVRVDAGYVLMAMGMVVGPEHGRSVRTALDALVTGLQPWHSRSSVLSYLQENAALSEAYDQATIARLQRTKRVVDPAGVFRSNHPVLNG